MPSLLQVACSLKGPGWATARQCNQYPEYCDGDYVGNVTAPRQQLYAGLITQGVPRVPWDPFAPP